MASPSTAARASSGSGADSERDPTPDSAGRHTYVTALEYLQQQQQIQYTLHKHADEKSIEGSITVRAQGSQEPLTYQASFGYNYHESWCREKCAKILLRKASLVCEAAAILYKELDPKMRFFQGEVFMVEEGRNVEFKGGPKPQTPMQYEAAKKLATESSVGHTVCAFLNGYLHGSSGGSVFIGIHDSGRVHGVAMEQRKQDFASSFSSSWEEHRLHNKQREWRIIKFLKEANNSIQAGEAVCEVENDRGLRMELYSQHTGTVVSLYNGGQDDVPIDPQKGPLMEVLVRTTDAAEPATPSVHASAPQNPFQPACAALPPLPLQRSQSDSAVAGLPLTGFPEFSTGVVQGIDLSLSRRDELKRAVLDSLLRAIEPPPTHLVALLLHSVDPPKDELPPAPRPDKDKLPDNVNAYIDNLEQQLKQAKAKNRLLQGEHKNTMVLEIRVAAGDELRFYHKVAYERASDVGSTTAIPLESMKRIVAQEYRKSTKQA